MLLAALSLVSLATVMMGYNSEVGQELRGIFASSSSSEGGQEEAKIWVSMSVCFGDSEKRLKKKNFPYLLGEKTAIRCNQAKYRLYLN